VVDIPVATLIAAGLVFLAAVFGTIAIVLAYEAVRDRSKRRAISKQLERLSVDELMAEDGSAKLFRRQAGRGPKWVEVVSSRIPQLKDVDFLIEQAALTWSRHTFLILTGGFALAFGMGTLIAFQRPFYVVLAVFFGGALPLIYVRAKRSRRMRAFEEGLPEAIDLLGRALRAGHPFSSGLKMVSDETVDPIAGEFRRVFEEQRFGLGVDESLLGMADRIPLVDVRIFVTAVLIQREVGGNLAEILDKLSEVVRQRFSIMRQLRTFTAQGRMSGYILGGLPIFLGLVLFFMNRKDMVAFIVHPIGRVMMSVAVVLQILGYLWISRIVKIEV
jgi:tight adherence protein B